MILLDENVPEAQRREMARLGLAVRQVGFEWGRKGMSDGEILTALQGMRRVTFLTNDADFYRRGYCHTGYCLVVLAVSAKEMAYSAHRFLRQKEFRTFAGRSGKVARVQPTGVVYWERRAGRERELTWSD